jgi:parallel beta-helix repeat protein
MALVFYGVLLGRVEDMKAKIFFFWLIFILVETSIYADTPIIGFIAQDTKWIQAESPYIALGSVVVNEGVTLTVEPGVVVEFESKQRLTIDGVLIARGTAENTINFISKQDQKPGAWGGILFENSGIGAKLDGTGNYLSGSILQYCIVECAETGVEIVSASPLIDHCVISKNANSGVSISDGDLVIRDSTIADNRTGVGSTGSLSAFLTGNTITGNKGSGVFIWANNKILIDNNTIRGNITEGSKDQGYYYGDAYGGGIYISSSTVVLSNNTIEENKAIGENSFAGGVFISGDNITISHNTVSKNIAQSGWYSAYGGGVYVKANKDISTVIVDSNIFTENKANGMSHWLTSDYYYGYGGGLYISGGNTTISNNTFTKNSGVGGGGAIYMDSVGIADISNNKFTENDYGLDISAKNTTIKGNVFTANSNWAIYMSSYNSSVNDNIFINDNTFIKNEDGIFVNNRGTTVIASNKFTENSGNQVISVSSIVRGTYTSDGAHIYEGNGYIIGNTITDNKCTSAAVFIDGTARFNKNAIFNNQTDYNLQYGVPKGSPVLDATNNYWGITNEAEIRGKIYDFFQDASLANVDVIPFLTTPPDPQEIENFLDSLNFGCAIIVTASGVSLEGIIDNKANEIYKSLKNLGFADNKIFYLNDEAQDPDGDGDNDVDSDNTRTRLEEAITTWAPNLVGQSAPLIIYVASHGSKVATFELNKKESITSLDLNLWLNEFSKKVEAAKIIIVIDTCYSGSFITDPLTSISAPNRIIITSTRDNKMLSGLLNHFSYGFFKWLEKGENVLQAFNKASKMDLKTGVILGEPWIDDNGDHVGHPSKSLEDDGKVAATVKIGIPIAPFTEEESFISTTLFSPGELRVYDSEGRVTGLVNGTIKEDIPNSVYIEESKDVIIFPSANNYRYEVVGTDAGKYGLTVSSIKGEEATTFNAEGISITPKATHQYIIDWDNLVKDGKGTIVNIDSNSDGKFEGTVTTGITLIDTDVVNAICVKGDVNSDGDVKSNDAILILRISAGLMTPTPQQQCAADMNDDGKVGANDAILILRKVAGLEAPSKDPVADRHINISLSEAHGLKGETISVPITVDNIDILSSGDMSISYDSKILRAIDVLVSPSNEEGTNDGLLMANNTSQPGLIRISFAGVERLNNGKLAEIRFEVLTDDVSPLTFKMAELYGTDALPLNSKFTNKQFRSWAVAPELSALLQNYPNPFNPETWIPYQLHESSEVVIRIYNVSGELVREFSLGYKSAGIYTNQDRSAYWDGRNEAGERVSSGVYFYNIQAGNYNAIMKMVISK